MAFVQKMTQPQRQASLPQAGNPSANFTGFPARLSTRLRNPAVLADSLLRVPQPRVKNRAGPRFLAPWLATAVAACLTVRLSAIMQDVAAIEAPTPVEQALIEQRCSATRATSAADTGAYHNCLTTELLGIRTDFGRDLGKLSPGERRAMDAVCNKVRNLEGRDAYVACLSGQLAALHARRNPTPAAPAVAAQAPDLTALAEAVATAPPSSGSAVMLWSTIGVAALLAASVAGFFLTRRRRPASKCRTCGVAVPGGGDLCQGCRHAAADALRRATLERAEQEQHEKEQVKRQQAQEDVWRLEQARQEELARRQQMERARREEDARREEEERRREEEARERSQFGADAVFDPYTVLGVSPDANRDSIESAYEEAKSKYDAAQVAHLSAEVQEHFRQKAQAVERAYQMLTAAV